MKNHSTTLIILVIALVLLAFATLYTVKEGEHGVLVRLGELVKDSEGEAKVYAPGLHVKIPVVTQARLFDTRLQTLDIESSRIVTQEKKDVLVDYYVKWRVSDLPLYFTRTGGNKIQAETLIQQQVNDGLRSQFGQRDISEVVSGERTDIMKLVQEQVSSTAKTLGVEIIDVRIKRIDLPTEVSAAVFDRMRAERKRIANKHRGDGKSKAEAIGANADAQAVVIVAQARSDGNVIRGEGDAQAAAIYAEAFSQDADFFRFYRSINAYKEVFGTKQDLMVIQPDSDFFSYFLTPEGSVE